VRLSLLPAALALMLCPVVAQDLSKGTPNLSIAHAAIRISDLAKSREFYRKLGFEEAFVLEKDGSPTEVFVKVNDRQFIELYPRETSAQGIGFMHVCFESSDLDGLNRIYRERGVSTTKVARGSAGNLLFSIKYPHQQVIEFTEYMAGSMHSNDRGKHLGTNRISTHLASVGMPVEDPAAAVAFYEDKLGFRRAPFTRAHAETILLPGPSGETVDMLPHAQGSGVTLFFSVLDLRETESALRDTRLILEKHETSVSIRDPDGNRIVFVKN
jgi:catechol 2,3-dioxygenase-like lactoylglutathione lyase family enzyme